MKIMHKSRLNSLQSWRSILSILAFIACLIPCSFAIGSTLDDSVIEADLMTSPEFELSQNSGSYLYSAASSLGEVGLAGNASIEALYQRLHDTSIANLGSATYVPISVGDINFVIPTYNNPIHVGDAFVQSRYIRFQVRELLGRHLVNADDPAYANEAQQLATLYQNAYSYALTSKNLYGTRLTMARDASTIDMIWPEIRNINGQNVVVPVLYLTAATVANRRVSEHEVFFGGNVTFNSISLTDVNIKAGRQTFINAVHDLTVDGAKILGSGELSLVAGGNINLLSGEIRNKGELQLAADGNINLKSSTINSTGSVTINAQNLTAQTVVQRVDYGNGRQGSSYGRITSINSANGDVTVHTSKDITLQGVRVTAGEGITFGAGGNIYIGSVALNDNFTGRDGNWNVESSSVDYLVSSLSAEETIQLMAGGHITLDAAQIASDEGHIEILAGLGITIEDEMAEHRTYQKGKFGKKKKEITDYQTVAIRSILDAGKGVRLHTDLGDITLKATEITSAEGAHVSASNGKVNLLLSKELDHYSYVSTYKGTFKIKNRNEGHYIETAIPNAIVGGLKVEAAYGLNVEYVGDPNLSFVEQIGTLSKLEGMQWIAQICNPDANWDDIETVQCNNPDVNWIEAQLAYDTWKESNSSVTPALAALITVVVAVVTGGAGIGLTGLMTTAVGGSTVLGGALAAGITAMASQTTIALASGNIRSMSDMVEFQTSSETMRNVASSMITAGAVASVNNYFDTGNFFDLEKGATAQKVVLSDIQLVNQAAQAVVNVTVKAGVGTMLNGGDLGDFRVGFRQSLIDYGVNILGKHMAQGIKNGFDVNDPTAMDTAIKYILHAGAGCVIGVAKAENYQNQSASDGCSNGAMGGVVGEAVGSAFRSSEKVEQAKNAIDGLMKKNADYIAALRAIGYSNGEIVEILSDETELGYYEEELDNLKSQGVALAQFSASLAAFMAGADAVGIDVAGGTGANAAENNALFLIVLAPIAIKAIDVIWTGMELYEEYDKIKAAYAINDAAGEEALREFLGTKAGEYFLEAIIPGGKIFDKVVPDSVVQAVKDAGIRSADDVLNAMEAKGGVTGEVANYAKDRLRGEDTRTRLKETLDDLPIQPSREVPAWTGSGPQSGVLGVNSASSSTKALENYYPSTGVEFVFDPTTSTFLVRGKNYPGMHSMLANSINAPTDSVVGGILKRDSNGLFITDESSGHFHQNWTPEVRDAFVKTMNQYGFQVDHYEGMRM